MDVVVVTDGEGYGWHAGQIRDALNAHGCTAHFVALPRCVLSAETGGQSVRMPGFEERLPDGVLVRNVPRGSLQEVVFYLGVLHALRRCGVPVCNDAFGIERTVDKSMTSFLLHRAGIATPATWAGCDGTAARKWAMHRLSKGRRVVAKPLFGSQGQGLRLICREDDLEADPEGGGEIWFGGVHYLQEFVEVKGEGWYDWRVFVVDGRAVAAMSRHGETWINNAALGSRCSALKPAPFVDRVAERAAQVCGLSYAGVDLMPDIDGGIQVIEVNSIPSWKNLQETTAVDITDTLIKHFLSLCHAGAA